MSVRIGPGDAQGYHWFYGHAQTLGRREWRGWWRIWRNWITGSIEYHLSRPRFEIGFNLQYDSEELKFLLGLYLLGSHLWLGLGSKILPRTYADDDIYILKLELDGLSLYYTFWSRGMNGKRSGVYPIVDRLLGYRQTLERHDLGEYALTVPLHEGQYGGVVKVEGYVFARPRWAWLRRKVQISYRFRPNTPIPVPDNPDCDFYTNYEAMYEIGLAQPPARIDKQIAEIVERVMRERVRHGGTQWLTGVPVWRVRMDAA